MINLRLPLVSTLSVILIACGAGSPLESPASIPSTPTIGPATGDITPPDTSNSDSENSVDGETTLAEQSNGGSTIPSVPATPDGESDTTVETVTLPVTCSASTEDIRVRVLDLINTARAEARSCGTEFFAATSPLAWNTQLLAAARTHSEDMAQHNFFSHTGSDGSNVGDRATAAGFTWQRIGENIAAGQTSAESAVNGWIDSPGHCRNLMNPNFTEVSVACVENSDSDYNRYWTNVLGTPF